MKNLMLIIGVIISLFTMSASAGQTRVEVHRWNHESFKGSIERAPIHLPTIDIIYESSTHSIEFISSMDCDATIFVYDIHGNIIAMSDSLDDIIYVPSTIGSVLYIRIESDNWYGTAEIIQ